MESEWEKEIRELLDSLERFSIENLMKEIMEAPLPFIDYEPLLSLAELAKERRLVNRSSVLLYCPADWQAVPKIVPSAR